ncbi:MAG: sigma-54 dependent transcriptional regulator [Stappiaceae bacterium]
MQQPRSIKIGVVEDDAIMGASLVQRFELEGHSVDWWQTGSDAVNTPVFFEKDIIICDIRLPDITGETVLRQASRDGMAPPFLFITAYGEIDQAVRLMKMGASDYITKPFELDEFLKKVERSAKSPTDDTCLPDVLGVSAAMQDLQSKLAKFAQTNFPVLITGETGVGKESAARFLHANAQTSGDPFIAVNCATIPDDILDQELFGYGKTKAEHRPGYAQRVDFGTLFLNEVCALPPTVQVKLLQVVEEGRFVPVGTTVPEQFRGRLVVANTDPVEDAVNSGRFSAHLSFRLSVLAAHISPLRSRPDDVEWLLGRMLREACARQGQLPKSVSAQAEELALAHEWLGNAYEMRNRVERAVALTRNAELRVEDLFPERTDEHPQTPDFQSLARAREFAEKRQIRRALQRVSGQVGEAAKLLGVSRTTLWEKMSKLQLRDTDGSDS